MRGNPICASLMFLGTYALDMCFGLFIVRGPTRMQHVQVEIMIWAMHWRCVIVLLSIRGTTRMPHVQIKI